MKKYSTIILALAVFLLSCDANYDAPPPPKFRLYTEIGGFELTKSNLTKYGIPYESVIYKDREYLAWPPEHEEKARIIWQGNFSNDKFGESQYYFQIQHNDKALKLLTASAEENNPHALIELGLRHVNGRLVDKDYSKAKSYYEKAAGLNIPAAYANLGALYENGFGVNKDNKIAFLYYLKSAETEGDFGVGICWAYRLLDLDLLKSDVISKEELITRAKAKGIDCVAYLESLQASK